MKTFLLAAACFAVAVAGPTRFVPVGPGGPAPVVVDNYEPISVGPAIVDGSYEPISVGPAIVDGSYEPISVGPAIVDGDYEPISVGPAIVGPPEYDVIEKPIDVGPAVPPVASSSPLVQIVINVNSDSANAVSVDASPVVPSPVDIVDSAPIVVGPGFETFPVEEDIDTAPVIVGPIPEPSPVDFVDNVEVDPTPVIVVEEAEVAEPVVVAPIVPGPVINVPEILN